MNDEFRISINHADRDILNIAPSKQLTALVVLKIAVLRYVVIHMRRLPGRF